MTTPFVPIEHTSQALLAAIGDIDRELARMFDQVDAVLSRLGAVIESDDPAINREVIAMDTEINRLETEVSMHVATAIARFSPVAHDLHTLMGAVKMAQELERLADHGKNICRRDRHVEPGTDLAFHAELRGLASSTTAMFHEFTAACRAQDYERAIAVRRRDQEVNDLYHKIMDRACRGGGGDEPTALVNSLLNAKDFERIGDRIKNLTEIIHYQRTGENLDFDPDQ